MLHTKFIGTIVGNVADAQRLEIAGREAGGDYNKAPALGGCTILRNGLSRTFWYSASSMANASRRRECYLDGEFDDLACGDR